MARINLLPWRTERRKQREREFYMMLIASAVGAAVVLLALIGWMGARIDTQQERNTYLTNEIKSLDKQIEEIKELDKTRSQLLTRKQIIEQLQSNRSQMVHLFDEMVRTIPDGVRLTSMKQAGDTLTLEGVAESNARVASYMRNIDNSPWMGKTDLRKIENKAGTKDVDKKAPYVFSLDVKLRKPEDAQNSEKSVAEGGAADNAATGANPEASATSTNQPAGADNKKPDLGAQLNDAASKLTKAPATAPATPTSAPPAAPAKDSGQGEKK
jgi:type IV pilus assembly protein PilN